MGLGTSNSNITYLSITEGRIAKRLKTAQQGSVEVVNKKGEVRHEMQFKDVSGYIKDIKVREHQYGKEWQVYLEDGEDTFCLSFPYSSRYANGFLMAIQNLNLNKKIVFSPWMKVVDDKKKTNLYLKHEGDEKSVEWFYSQEDPKGLPQLKQLKVKGVLIWDDTEKMEFLQNMMDTVIVPKLNKAKVAVSNNNDFENEAPNVYKAMATPNKKVVVETEDDDDGQLPF